MNDSKLYVILAAIGLAVFYLRNYVGAKAKNLANKEDLRHLTDIVERVRAQFERANLVHRVQFEAEFRACQNLFLAAHNAHREFVRLFPASVTSPEPEGQAANFVNAQLAFADTQSATQSSTADHMMP